MTATAWRAPAPALTPTRAGAPAGVPRVLLDLGLFLLGALMAAAGLALTGASWILPDGLLAGGVALMVVAPFSRGALEPLVALSPFMFYTLSPVGGILTVGSSDAFLPAVVIALVAGAMLGARRVERPLPGATLLLLLSVLVIVGTTLGWTLFSPSFLTARAIADAVKLGIGLAYLVVTYLLARHGGHDVTVRAFRLWGWTATALSVGSLVGATGAVEIVPSDGYRSLGYFEDANLYAGYLLVSLSVVLFLSTLSRSPLLAVQALLIVGGIVTTGSRGGLVSLALLVAFATVVVNSARLRLTILAATAAVSGAAFWLLANRPGGTPILGLDRLFFASQDVGDDPRLALWGRAVEKWMESPVWGIGLGQFERFSGDIFRVARSSGLGYVTHNSFLFFLVGCGIIGLAVFVAFLLWLVVLLYRADGLPRASRHALASGVLVLVSQMMTLNLQNLRYVWIYFGLVLGISVLHTHHGDEEADAPVAVPAEAPR